MKSSEIKFPQSAEQHCCQNSLVINANPFSESAERYYQFSGLQEGTSSEQIASMLAFDTAMIGSEWLEASADQMNNMFPEFAKSQEEEAKHSDDLTIWDMINELFSSNTICLLI